MKTAKLKDVLLQLLTTRVAWPVLLSIGLLCTMSLLAIHGASAERAQVQEKFLMLGLAVMVLVLIPHYQVLGHASWVLFIGVVLLLVVVLFTDPIKGSHRWFRLPGGFQFQPSELAKITYIMALAWYLRYRRSIRTLTGLIGPFLITAVPMGLILVEPDLGTALLFVLVLYAMLLAAGARARHLALIAMTVVLLLPGFFPFLREYQQERVMTLLYSTPLFNQEARERHLNRGMYQQHMSKVSIATGGVWGAEHNDIIERDLLPEAHTDFIFAVIGNKWGFLGCGLVILLYMAFFAASMEIAGSSRDPYARMMAVGLATLILGQAFINMAMNIGLGPVVGIALPFVSYGGSSLLSNFVSVGLLLNISIRRNSRAAGDMPGEM